MPKRASPKTGLWVFNADGKYIVKLKAVPRNNSKKVHSSDIKVSCTCNFFRWQGPEFHAQANDYLLGPPIGNAKEPKIRDPDGFNTVCKHVAAVFNLTQHYKIRNASIDHLYELRRFFLGG